MAKILYLQRLERFISLQIPHNKRVMGKFFIAKGLRPSFGFKKKNPGGFPPRLSFTVSSIACLYKLLRHEKSLDWGGDLPRWGLTGSFAPVLSRGTLHFWV
jgi:hypothetical protein